MAKYKKPAPERRVPDPDVFNLSTAISFHTQPYLRDLFTDFADENSQVAFVIGAGVSKDAGFPSWNELIERLAKKIPNRRHGEFVLAESDDPMRTAETILRLIAPTSLSSDAENLREALYREMGETVPGPLARAIARIAFHARQRCVILTTNFDDVIETALDEDEFTDEPSAHSLYGSESHAGDRESYLGVKEWKKATSENGPLAVMHLHGMVGPRIPPLEPLILTESHFLRHGSKTRELLREVLSSRIVVFVGVSMTDPNLVGPLWDLAQEVSRPCYVLIVPSSPTSDASPDEARSFAIRKSEYLETTLGVRPIFLKSYSQLHQLFVELELRMKHDDYFDEKREPPLIYGRRYLAAIDRCYRSVVGANAGTDRLNDLQHASGVANKLAGLVAPGSVSGDLLRRPDVRVRERLRELRRSAHDFDPAPEEFAVALWLRAPRSGEDDEEAPYALDLVAASDQIWLESRQSDFRVLIESGSDFPAAYAVYSGQVQFQSVDETLYYGPWRGALAIPLTVETPALPDAGTYNEVVRIGAIEITTTNDPFPRPKSADPVSVMAALQSFPDRINELVTDVLLRTTPILNGDLSGE